MTSDVPFAAVPEPLAAALQSRGFTSLTAVQQAVLDPELVGRDLRISSRTGSGKTVAIGLVLASALEDLESPQGRQAARPRVLLIAPTRELAAQIAGELSWLYQPLGVRVVSVTGGTPFGGDVRALREQPQVVVGTPGRLVDHLDRGTLDLWGVRAAVLDEADEMLDMGFAEDLAKILDVTAAERRTHLVSATLPREVLGLADRYQRDAVAVQGTSMGAAHEDIEHVGHLVRGSDRLPALINLLLAAPESRTLVFVRTRAATTEIATALAARGFSATALSGEMGQRERTATLEAFRADAVRIVVATDVAARGLDIADVTQVVHFDLPENPEVLTHRSGRTGRAGNKGTSVALVPVAAQRRFEHHLRRAGIRLSWRPVPTAAEIHALADARLLSELSDAPPADARLRALADALLADADPAAVVASLLARGTHTGPCAPCSLQTPSPAAGRDRRPAGREHTPRGSGSFTPFHVSWGARSGANPSRVLAMVCRRGDVRSKDIGAIRIGENRTVVEVATHLAAQFERAAGRPDSRNPKLKIRPWDATADRRSASPVARRA